jgi:hypothetical protein
MDNLKFKVGDLVRYKDDYTSGTAKIVTTDVADQAYRYGLTAERNNWFYTGDGIPYRCFREEALELVPVKVKKSGWIHIGKNKPIFKSKEEALANMTNAQKGSIIDTVLIEYEDYEHDDDTI